MNPPRLQPPSSFRNSTFVSRVEMGKDCFSISLRCWRVRLASCLTNQLFVLCLQLQHNPGTNKPVALAKENDLLHSGSLLPSFWQGYFSCQPSMAPHIQSPSASASGQPTITSGSTVLTTRCFDNYLIPDAKSRRLQKFWRIANLDWYHSWTAVAGTVCPRPMLESQRRFPLLRMA